MALLEPSAFSDGENEGCGLHICIETKLFRIERQKTMKEIGADIPESLMELFVQLISCREMEGLFNQLLLY